MERKLVLILIILVGSFTSLGCQREVKKKTGSTVFIQVPKASNGLNKTGGVGSLSAMPSDRKACYGIIVSGEGISQQPASSCSPPISIAAGFVEPGNTVQVDVPRGLNRQIDLYAYLQSAGANDPCPAFTGQMPPAQVVATYKIGTAYNIDTNADETPVAITADFPGLSNHIGQTLSLPASCMAGANPPGATPGFFVSNGQGVATNGTVSLSGGFGRSGLGASASNGSVTLKIK